MINLHFIDKFSEGDAEAQAISMRKYFTLTELDEANFIFCGSIAKMEKAFSAVASTGLPLIVYCWDYYKWAHEGKHLNWNWGRYRELLLKASLIIVPSEAQRLRLSEYGFRSVVIESGVTTYELPTSDGGFILDPLRYYPEENGKWAEEAAALLKIPIIHSEHQYSEEEFRKLVASCTFLTSCVKEASTGALTLMEGLWLGKPSLVSDSPYQGAKSYVGEYGTYFKHDSFDDLVSKMKHMWEKRSFFDKVNTREYMRKDFTYDAMARKIYENI